MLKKWFIDHLLKHLKLMVLDKEQFYMFIEWTPNWSIMGLPDNVLVVIKKNHYIIRSHIHCNRTPKWFGSNLPYVLPSQIGKFCCTYIWEHQLQKVVCTKFPVQFTKKVLVYVRILIVLLNGNWFMYPQFSNVWWTPEEAVLLPWKSHVVMFFPYSLSKRSNKYA